METTKIPKGTKEIRIKRFDDRVVIEFVPDFKRGDFVVNSTNDFLILKEIHPTGIKDYVYFNPTRGGTIINETESFHELVRHCTPDEKKLFLNTLRRDGKVWNEEKKCIEDIHKFKVGDKVMLRNGCKDIKNGLDYLWAFDDYIGQELTVCCYTKGGNVRFNEISFSFAEEWLEPYKEELKEGDLAIFWDETTVMGVTICRFRYRSEYGRYADYKGRLWRHAVKLQSKEQIEDILRGI